MIIEDVDRALEALEIIYLANGAAVEGLAYNNGHRRPMVGGGKIGRWGGARSKGEGRKCKIDSKMF